MNRDRALDSYRQTLMHTIDTDWTRQWDDEVHHLYDFSVSKTEITNGYDVTWTFKVEWSWNESTNVDFYAWSYDDHGAENAIRTKNNRNAHYENDMAIALSIEPKDPVTFGETYTVKGYVAFENSSVFPNDWSGISVLMDEDSVGGTNIAIDTSVSGSGYELTWMPSASDIGPHTFYVYVSNTHHEPPNNSEVYYDIEDVSVEPNKWTVIAYLNGDNNLELIHGYDLIHLSENGSRPGVNIVALIDRSAVYGWPDDAANVYFIEYDGSMTEIPLNAIDPSWSTEVDMDSSSTLSKFAKWAISQYPADNYLLALFDHGSSWLGCCSDDTTGQDDNTGITAMLDLTDIREALASIKAYRDGRNVELLVFNTCLMSSMEVAYNIQSYVDYMVASELISWGDDWWWMPYNRVGSVIAWEDVIGGIQSNPSISPQDLSDLIVDIARAEATSNEWNNRSHSWAAIDMEQFLLNVVPSFEAFASSLLAGWTTFSDQITTARLNTDTYQGPLGKQYDRIVDLRRFADLLLESLPSSVLRTAAQALVNALNNIYVDTFTHQGTIANSDFVQHVNGLSIHFPETAGEYLAFSFMNEQRNYEQNNIFASNTGWDEFLHEYLALPVAEDDDIVVLMDSSNVRLDVLANDSDPAGQDLIVSWAEPPDHGTVSQHWSAIFYTPASDYHGTDTFMYGISNTDQRMAWATVNIYVDRPPSLTTVNQLIGAQEDTDFAVTYEILAAAADEADPDGDTVSFRIESLISGTLTKNGIPITPGVTLLGPGETLVWRGPRDDNGLIGAFITRAWDGHMTSANSCQVRIQVDAVNDPPILSGIPYRQMDEDGSLNHTLDLWTFVWDAETPPSGLMFSIVDETDPRSGVSIDGNRYIDISPAADWNGTSDVTV